MTNKPTITIVIANYNGFDDLKICLRSIKKLSYPRVKTIVFDNNSPDKDGEKIKKGYPWVNLFAFKKNYGFCGGYNRVLETVKSPYVFLINNDTVVTKNILDTLVAHARKNPKVAIIQPKILSLDHPHMFEYAGASGGYVDSLGYPFCRGRLLFYVEKDKGQYDEAAPIFWASGTAMFCRLAAIKSVGLFDEDLFAYVEEHDLCWRVWLAGYRIVALPQAVIYHKGLGSWGKYLNKKIFLIHRNNLLVLVKNSSFRRLIIILPLRLLLDYVAVIYYLATGRPSFTISVVKAHMSVAWLFSRFWKKRGKLQKGELQLMWPRSIVFTYFVRGIRKFSDLAPKRDPRGVLITNTVYRQKPG